MRILKTLLLGSLGAAALISSVAAATVVPVPDVPNSSKTTVFGINDYDVIVGSYIGQDKIEHAFFGTLDGNYTTFDTGAGGTEARGINNAGAVIGYFNSQDGSTSDQTIFIRKPGGKLQLLSDFAGRAQGINNANQFAGAYWDFIDFDAVAFFGQHGKIGHPVRIPAVHQASEANGINNEGVVVGDYFQPPVRGFIGSGNKLQTVNYPAHRAAGTTVEGINDNGQAVGQWFSASGRTHSFLLDIASNTFTDIEVPGAKKVAAWAINNAGAVAVSTDIGSFIWCASDTSCPARGAPVKAAVHVGAKPSSH